MRLMRASFFTQHIYYAKSNWFHYNAGFLERLRDGEWSAFAFFLDCEGVFDGGGDRFLLKCNEQVLVYENDKKKSYTKDFAKELMAQAAAFEIGPYMVRVDRNESRTYTYTFSCSKTNKVFKYETRNILKGADDKYIYFRVLSPGPGKILKQDVTGNVVSEFEIDNSKATYLGEYIVLFDKSSAKISVFNLTKFTVIKSEDCYYRSRCELFYCGSGGGVDFFKTDSGVLTWDGVDFKWHFQGREVSSLYPKNDFVYITFIGDSNLYAYDTALNKNMGQQKLIEGYGILYFYSTESSNYVAIQKDDLESDVEIGAYLSFWEDGEFFSDAWELEYENIICGKNRVDDRNEKFNIYINVNKHENFSVVARQSIAMLDDVIRGYGVGRQEPISKNFTGKVTLCYKDAKYIKKQQRSQLDKAAKDLVDVKYSLFEGPATGDYCSVELVFED